MEYKVLILQHWHFWKHYKSKKPNTTRYIWFHLHKKPRISQTTKVKLFVAEWIEGNVDDGKREQGFLQGYSYALKLTVTAQLWKYQNPLNYIHLTETAINLKILPSSSPIFLGIDHKNILWPTLSMIGLRPPFQKVSLSHIQPSPAERDIKAKKKWRKFLFLPLSLCFRSHPSVQSISTVIQASSNLNIKTGQFTLRFGSSI